MRKISRKVRTGVYVFLSVFLLNSCSSTNTNPPPVHFVEDDYLHATGADTMPKVYTVTIEQMKFEPSEIKVKKGDTVVFVNNDIVTHDITEESSKAWTSKPLPANASWKLAVTQSSGYYCSIHPMMKGKILVQ
jgi:plastocyanin